MRYFASIPLYHLSKLNATTMLIGSCFAAPRAVFFFTLSSNLLFYKFLFGFELRHSSPGFHSCILDRVMSGKEYSRCGPFSKKWDQEGWLACFAISLSVFWWHQNKFQTWPNQGLLMVSWVKPFVSISFQNLTWQQRYCPSLDTCWSTALGQVFTWWPLSCFQPFSGNHGRQIHLNVCVWWGTCFVFRCAV